MNAQNQRALWIRAKAAFFFLLLTFPTGCNFAPKYSRPSVQTPNAFKELTPKNFKETDGWKTAEPKDNVIRGDWWTLFDDEQLNALEKEASMSNQSIAASVANFLAARALVKQARSQLFPTITANPSVTRSQQRSGSTSSGSAQSGLTPSSSSTRTTFSVTQYNLPLDASWEPDFWGRIRNAINASSFEAQATFADLENVRLTIHSEIATDYFQIRALDEQKRLLDAAVTAYQESLRLTQARHETGIASEQDVAQAETQLTTTQAQATDLGIQRAQLEHAIALLIGKPASVFSIDEKPLDAKPMAIPFGVPSVLLERRPDIAAAERRVAEMNAQIGVARAAYFPTVSLSGTAGYQNTSLANLASWPSLAWSVGASLAETVFDAGRRKGVTEQAWANYQLDVANYRQTVLTAFQEVEDSLATLRILSKELREQDAAVKASQRYLTLAKDRYKFGIDSFLNVITAQTTLLTNQRAATTLRMEQMTATVALIKALGGGWDTSELPAKKTGVEKYP